MRQRKDDDAEGFWPWGSDHDEGSEPVEPAPRQAGNDDLPRSALPPRRAPSESVLPSPRHSASVDRRSTGSPNRLRRGKAWGAPDRRTAADRRGPVRPAPARSSAQSAEPETAPRPQTSAPAAPRQEQPRRLTAITALGGRGQDLGLLLLAVVVAALVVLALLG